jgi:hypothetical protein
MIAVHGGLAGGEHEARFPVWRLNAIGAGSFFAEAFKLDMEASGRPLDMEPQIEGIDAGGDKAEAFNWRF